jgi:hypothetical protein
VFERLEGALEDLQIISVANTRDVPSMSDETGGDIIAEC